MAIRGSLIASRWAVLFIIAKVSSTRQFAVVTVAMAYVEIFRYIFDFGIDTHSIRNFSILKSVEDRRGYYSSVLCTKIISGFAACAILAGIFLLNYDGAQSAAGVILSIQIISTLLMNLPISYYQSQLNVISIGPQIVILNILSVLSMSYCAAILQDINYALVSLVIFDLILAALLIRKMHDSLGGRVRIELSGIIGTIRAAIHLGVSNSITIVYSRLDMILLSKLSDIISVGMYGFAYRLTEPFHYTAANYSISVYSDMSSKQYELDDTLIQRHRREYIRKAAAIGMFSAVSCYVISYVLVHHFFTNYLAALPLCLLLSGLLFFKAINTTLTSIINSTGNYRIMVGISLVNIVMISSLLYVLITLYGAPGAAYALLIGEIVNTLLQCYIVLVLLADRSGARPGWLRKRFHDTFIVTGKVNDAAQ